jgi:hypothetical protein
MATPSSYELINSAKTSANSLAGYLTNQIRQIEQLSSWSSNRDLRHWHRQFSEARLLLTARPPARVDRYAPTELPDDDNATWLELIGAQ